MPATNAAELRRGILKSVQHLRDAYARSDDLMAAARKWGCLHYLQRAFDETATREQLDAAIEEVVDRLDTGTELIRKGQAEGRNMVEAEDKWITLLNVYMALVEAAWRPA